MVIKALWPRSDRAAGGATITIFGSGFVSGCTLTVDGASTSVTFVSATRLTFTAPAHAAGIVSVQVTNPDTSNDSENFTYYTAAADDAAMVVDIGGVEVAVRDGSVNISLAALQGTCTFQMNSEPPELVPVRIGLGSVADADLLFNGFVQRSELTYEDSPTNLVWSVTCTANLYKFKKRAIWARYTNESATDIALDLLDKYGDGFSGVNVAAGLPVISISIDGLYLDDVFQNLKRLIQGSLYLDKSDDVHLYVDAESGVPVPDTVDSSNSTLLGLNRPKLVKDTAQMRDRVIIIGGGSALLSDLAAGETIIPISDSSFFEQAGWAKIGSDQIITYTSRLLGAGGTVLGPGVTPSGAPTVVLASGSGVDSGEHKYAVVWHTATGDSLPSPLATIINGPLSAPSTAPTVSAPVAGAGPNAGSHQASVTFVDGAGGETTPSSLSSAFTTYDVSAPANGTLNYATLYHAAGNADQYGQHAPDYVIGDTIMLKFTAVNAAGETLIGGSGLSYTLTAGGPYGNWPYGPNVIAPSLPTGADYMNLYLSFDGGSTWYRSYQYAPWYSGTEKNPLGFSKPFILTQPLAPTSNTAYMRKTRYTIPTGPTGTAQRKVYRNTAGGSQQKLALTVTDNTTTSVDDTVPDASLGANAPVSNTSALNRNSLSNIAIGPSGTTQRKLYRTPIGSSQLKLVTTLGDNTTTTYTDSTADSALGANAPTSDTSGLTQPPGAIIQGQTSAVTAGAGDFSATGGWAVAASGRTAFRYTGISGNTLTGIPASGAGSINTTLSYGTSLVPAPSLLGVPSSGDGSLLYDASRDDDVRIVAIREDVTQQSQVAAVEGGNGVHDYKVTDSAITDVASAILRAQAELQLVPVTVRGATYETRDIKTDVGRLVPFDLDGFTDSLQIQQVRISEIGVAEGTYPRYSVTATNARFTLEEMLRRIIRGAA